MGSHTGRGGQQHINAKNNFIAAKEQGYNKDLYYQMTWRIPQLDRGTTVVMDIDSSMRPNSIRYASAMIINGIYDVNVKHRDSLYYGFRYTNEFGNSLPAFAKNNHISFQQFDMYKFNGSTAKVLVVSQPWHGCMRVVDSSNRDYMSLSPRTRLAASISEPTVIHINDSTRVNNAWLNVLYQHGNTKCWCYYFEKAELARQQGNWDKLTGSIEEAIGKKLKPDNDEEWVTYIEGCLHTKKYNEIENVLNKEVKTVPAKTFIYNMLKKWSVTGTDVDKQSIAKLMAMPFAYRPGNIKDENK